MLKVVEEAERLAMVQRLARANAEKSAAADREARARFAARKAAAWAAEAWEEVLTAAAQGNARDSRSWELEAKWRDALVREATAREKAATRDAWQTWEAWHSALVRGRAGSADVGGLS